LFLALEATFTYVFWALISKTDYGYGLAHVCQWDRDSLEYDGLCSHNPLTESPAGDYALSAEQLEAHAAEVKQRRLEINKEWRENTKAANPETYNSRISKNSQAYRDRHPGISTAAGKRCKNKAVTEKRHYCAICDHAFTYPTYLRQHLAGPKHAAKAALYQQSSS
jgi:hypothetical protein